jgi:choline dehydrogenase-like flavoprotein
MNKLDKSGGLLGGSTFVNDMVYTRGNRKDYDGWKEKGCDGWGYDDVLPYFLRLEDMLIPDLATDTKYHSTKGQLPITHPPYHTQSARDIIDAAVELGCNVTDYNAASQIGYSFHQCTMKNGTRISANRAYLEPARRRRNLHVLKNSLVTKILIHPENRTTYGAEYARSALPGEARARKEVILSAGAMNFPQLLMLSGIGPKEDLEKMGIPVIQDSKVGLNLQNHMGLGNLYLTANSTIGISYDNILHNVSNFMQYLVSRDGPLSIPDGTEALGFEDIDDDDGFPEIEITLKACNTSTWKGNPDIYEIYQFLVHKNYFALVPLLTYLLTPWHYSPDGRKPPLIRLHSLIQCICGASG